jgi:predicted component of type VI protein secretion system
LIRETEDNLKRNRHVTPQGSRFARFLPIDALMRQASSSVEALIEILDLCEQALTAVHNCDERLIPEPLADKYRQSLQNTRVKLDRNFVLIRGGLASESNPSKRP